MSRRRLPKGTVVSIGNERIARLMELAVSAAAEGRDDLARRYVTLARRISMKTKAKMPKRFRYCKECYTPLIPGTNCTVRLTGGKIVSRCRNCGAFWRMPYIRERSK